MSSTRGKTTPASTGGSFRPQTGRASRAELGPTETSGPLSPTDIPFANGAEVTVRHEIGSETGTVIAGTSPVGDETTRRYLVRFADRTESWWADSQVSPINADNETEPHQPTDDRRAQITVDDLPAYLATHDPDIGYSTYQADDTCWIAVTTSRSGTRITPYINEGGYGISADTIHIPPGESADQTICDLINTPPTTPAFHDERSERDGL